MPRQNLLMVADSEHDANMLYAVGLFIPDRFIYLDLQGQRLVVVNDWEIDRARRNLRSCRVLSDSTYFRKLQRNGRPNPSLAEIIRLILREHRIKKIHVPGDFPCGLTEELRKLKVKVRLKSGAPFPGRMIKSADEIKKISAALTMAEVGLSEAVQVLKRAKIGKGKRLSYHEIPLTVEKLRSVIHVAIMQAGGIACHTIVAPGKQACDPHETGHGLLRANEPIIINVFPRSQKTGYFGDITRTVVKGRASASVCALYQAVAQAQKLAFAKLRPGTPAHKVHLMVQDFFVDNGFKTGRRQGRLQGFLHGVGHGLGLEKHEPPCLSAHSEDILRPGHVVTLEPGLYYPQIGAVRLADVALVTSDRPRNLTKFEKVLEI
jgi:Xaa-Pro aminopeptidase